MDWEGYPTLEERTIETHGPEAQHIPDDEFQQLLEKYFNDPKTVALMTQLTIQ